MVVILKNCSVENPSDFLILCRKTQSDVDANKFFAPRDRSFARRAQNPSIADVICQVEPEIKMFWLPISLLFSSKIILKQLFASGSVNIGAYLHRLRLGKYINNSLHLARKYAQIFVRGHYLFREANSFPRAKLEENCELRGTDNVRGQISVHIFEDK